MSTNSNLLPSFITIDHQSASVVERSSTRHTTRRTTSANCKTISVKAQTTKCYVQSFEQASALRKAASSGTRPYMCPLCKRAFALKNIFNRHTGTALRLYNGTSFICTICGIRCSRKDILTRHETTRHSEQERTVQCNVCHQQIRRRALPGHQASQACKRADSHNGTTLNYTKDLLILSQLPAILDSALLSAWLFVKIKPWGNRRKSFDLWQQRSLAQAAQHSDEVLKLKTLLFKTIRKAMSSPGFTQDSYLTDALAILVVMVCMTDGWEMAQIHRKAFIYLVHQQLSASPTGKEIFSSKIPAHAYQDVLGKVVKAFEISKCERLIRMTISLLRLSAFDTICAVGKQSFGLIDWPAITEWINSKNLTPEMLVGRYAVELMPIAETASTIGTEGLEGDLRIEELTD